MVGKTSFLVCERIVEEKKTRILYCKLRNYAFCILLFTFSKFEFPYQVEKTSSEVYSFTLNLLLRH